MSYLKNYSPPNTLPLLKIATGTSPEFNAHLRDYILLQEKKLCGDAHIYRDTPNGVKEGLSALWETYNVLQWPLRECELLHGIFLTGYFEYLQIAQKFYTDEFPRVIQCWANVIRGPLEDEVPHQHNENPLNIVGVYYVSGDYKSSGSLCFYDKDGDTTRKIFDLKPQIGDLVFFPAPVIHGKGKYNEREPRISVAFDIRFEGNPHKSFIDFY